MLLLTLREWLGPSIKAQDAGKDGSSRVEYVGMATRLPLAEAIDILHEYEKAYGERYTMSCVNLHLLSVSVIDDLSHTSMEKARVECIETDLSNAIARYRQEIADRENGI
jgi:hypothetical protein